VTGSKEETTESGRDVISAGTCLEGMIGQCLPFASLLLFLVDDGWRWKRISTICGKFVPTKKAMVSYSPFMDCQIHRLAILITGKQICANLLEPSLFEVPPLSCRVLELDVLETRIVVKEANGAVEHVAILHVVYSQHECVQERQVPQRRLDIFLGYT